MKRGEAAVDGLSANAKNLLLIQGSRKKRKKRRGKIEDDTEHDLAPSEGDGEDDEELNHSESDQDVSISETEDDPRERRKKKGISRKEAKRRRAWGSDKDQAKAAGRPWPAIPRHSLYVLTVNSSAYQLLFCTRFLKSSINVCSFTCFYFIGKKFWKTC
jgi:hypothetical protein